MWFHGRRVLLALVVVLAGGRCAPSVAQGLDPAVALDAVLRKGLHAERSYFSPLPFEHFDPVSGNLVLTFVDLELPGNGGQFDPFSTDVQCP